MSELPQRLKEALAVRLKFGATRTPKEAVDLAVALSGEYLRPQTAAVFLLDDNRELYRAAIGGTDKDGNPIPYDWFTTESHRQGESLTGKALVPEIDGRWGVPQWVADLSSFDLSEESRVAYESLLGPLQSGIAVPLNGLHSTFGVLEVIHTHASAAEALPYGVTPDDVYWLSIIGNQLANTLSQLQRLSELTAVAEAASLLVPLVAGESNGADEVFQQAAELLSGRSTLYAACVIWERAPDGAWTLVGRAGAVDWSLWNPDPAIPEKTLNRLVAEQQQPEVVHNLEEHLEAFGNAPWIAANELKSYACYPLAVEGEALGTVSVYKKWANDFLTSDQVVVNGIAAVLAASLKIRRILNVRAEVNVGDRLALTDHDEEAVHFVKNEFLKVQRNLEAAIDESGRRGWRMVSEEIGTLDARISEFLEQIRTNPEVEPVDLNALLQAVRRESEAAQVARSISYRLSIDRDMPPLLLREMQIKQVFRNMVSNAEKAIVQAGRGYGQIDMEVRVADLDMVESAVITFTDDGCGITDTHRDHIFERGFSTYPQGSGTGLYSVRRTLQNYGGDVELLHSVVGQGSTFQLRIPIRRHLP